ncbi:cardiolipin synthetase [Formosa agariphila KMM 3901]|uniref:Cardiolipin synthase n=1 Tax=Formosa agariphila (strain DSM 15362 / KCTC 12365 / LMG 23005 / KMM 3901 / M-2Alg 35-1) TaxID=1347342 RepID=T2KLZ4_FORAG|nr:cardiolipin synthase [Formosa agariphila]CDF79750.1 cardiolipin synthetase [Formosa agariphila KMM 3901]
MDWSLILQLAYILIVLLVCLRVIYDTNNITKTLSYLLLVVFVPFFGIIFYFSFGMNYRTRKIYSKKLFSNIKFERQLEVQLKHYTQKIIKNKGELLESNKRLIHLLFTEISSPLTNKNEVDVLLNGEQKFPEVFKAIEAAKYHIHIEYYIFTDDTIGRKIEALLIKKAKEGVKIKFMYDDFGSSSIRKSLVYRLRDAGIEAYPFYKVKLIYLANRMNYRNHRKIIVIDGRVGFVGGINVSDRYINNNNNIEPSTYWRDTHLKIQGPAVWYLQYLFLCDWNFCANCEIEPQAHLFPDLDTFETKSNIAVQIAASGPDSETPTILYSLLQAISLAEREIQITTPYFVPNESIMDALCIASMSGVKVKLLVPRSSDSRIVNAAASSYYEKLLQSGVEIYRYNKGFIHAKTMAIDDEIAIVGSANMDMRSFDLNFEVNAIVYDKGVNKQLKEAFNTDLKDADQIDLERWQTRTWYHELTEKVARLLSPLL